MKYLKFLWSFISMGIAYAGIVYDGIFVWGLLIYAFGFIPLLELFTNGNFENISKEEEKKRKTDWFYDLMIYSIVPLQYGLLISFCLSISKNLLWWEIVGKVVTLGLACGVYGINVAHELGHRVKGYEQVFAKSLLLTSLYMHFFIEHNRGHHNNVSTPEDPASSRFNEPLYKFWIRSVYGCYVSAWHLEHFRLSKTGQPKFSVHNEMLVYQFIQVLLVLTIGFVFGWFTAICFCLSAVIGFLLLETVNYIEHYGLQRYKAKNGFHKVLPVHSWNSNHEIGRGILFELSRHSDHHFRANRKYQILKYHENTPQMPTGYPGMMLLSLFPPLWFKVMNPRVLELREKYSEQLASY